MRSDNKCIECENNTLQDYADLAIKYDNAQRHIKILSECLDTKEELCAFFREQNEELKNKLHILEQTNENER